MSEGAVKNGDVAIEMAEKRERNSSAGQSPTGPGISALESAMAAHAAMKARRSTGGVHLSGEGDDIWSGGSLRAQPS